MKASEICIGDWFKAIDYNSPFRITAIYDDVVQTQANYQSEIDGNWYSEAYIKDLVPIELTEEILEKNSIKISSFTGTLYWFDEDEHCCVKPIENRFMFMYSKGADYLTFRITYVHQLQHLLRLCGIEKELAI